jgi:hypothetical protein
MHLAALDVIERLRTQWGEVHIDIYASGVVVLSDTDVYQRNAAHGRVYRGTELMAVLTDAVNDEA